MLAALLVLAAAARPVELIPASARGAVVIESADGLRAFLQAASVYTRTLSPAEVGRFLRSELGVDVLAEDKAWGLGKGPRVVVFGDRAIALVAPVADAKAAKKAVAAWIHAKAPNVRAGGVTGQRLITASGPRAAALAALLTKPPKDALSKVPALRPALARAKGPVWAYVRAPDPLRAAILSIDARADGLTARGVVLPARGALLAAAPAPKCEGALGCVAVSPGETGRQLFQLELRELTGRAFAPKVRDQADRTLQRAASTMERLSLRFDGLDAHLLAGEDESIWAARWSAAVAPAETTAVSFRGPRSVCVESGEQVVRASSPCGPTPDAAPLEGAPPFALALDLAALDVALGKLSPLDALRGEIAAGAFAAHLLYGPLMKHAGPLTVRGSPARDVAGAADVELRLPLR